MGGLLGEAAALLKPAAKGAALGVVLYFVADTTSDVYTFFEVRRQALARARASADVASLLGEPLAPGPWYDGTLGFSHRDRVAHVTFQLAGTTRSTDVVARAARRPGGARLNIWYNAFGGGAWDLVTCQAMFPGEGGLAAPRNLMPPLPAVAAAAAAAGGGGGGGGGGSGGGVSSSSGGSGRGGGSAAGQEQQQQQKQQQQAGSRWWWPFPSSGGGGGSSSSGGGGGGSSSSAAGSSSPAGGKAT